MRKGMKMNTSYAPANNFRPDQFTDARANNYSPRLIY